ncbi:MAG: sulfur carrier protein ThiS [Proteobacteria bacterium]|nr:sulfur carrier protein ThiS [Pseudomonadota bacterium]
MWVDFNGKRLEVKPETTVRELLVQTSLADGPVAVELNHTIVPRSEHTTTMLAEGDRLEVVHFVGGG